MFWARRLVQEAVIWNFLGKCIRLLEGAPGECCCYAKTALLTILLGSKGRILAHLTTMLNHGIPVLLTVNNDCCLWPWNASSGYYYSRRSFKSDGLYCLQSIWGVSRVLAEHQSETYFWNRKGQWSVNCSVGNAAIVLLEALAKTSPRGWHGLCSSKQDTWSRKVFWCVCGRHAKWSQWLRTVQVIAH